MKLLTKLPRRRAGEAAQEGMYVGFRCVCGEKGGSIKVKVVKGQMYRLVMWSKEKTNPKKQKEN